MLEQFQTCEKCGCNYTIDYFAECDWCGDIVCKNCCSITEDEELDYYQCICEQCMEQALGND